MRVYVCFVWNWVFLRYEKFIKCFLEVLWYIGNYKIGIKICFDCLVCFIFYFVLFRCVFIIKDLLWVVNYLFILVSFDNK